MTIRKYLREAFSDGHFIYFKYDAKRAKDCSSAEGGHSRRSRGGWSAVSAELQKACFLRKQKCAHKKELFSRAILNLLVERESIRTSGKEVRELFDTVYADVVQGKKSDEAISVETTFSELCSNPDKSLGAEPVDSTVIEKLTEAKRNLPEQKTQELQKKVDAAVDNIIRNFSAVRMSTGMIPEEAVKLAAKTVGGKDSAVFVPPASGIVYQTPAMNVPFNARNGGDKRIFSDIRIADLIEKSKNLPSPTKEIEVERLIAESRHSYDQRIMSPLL